MGFKKYVILRWFQKWYEWTNLIFFNIFYKLNSSFHTYCRYHSRKRKRKKFTMRQNYYFFNWSVRIPNILYWFEKECKSILKEIIIKYSIRFKNYKKEKVSSSRSIVIYTGRAGGILWWRQGKNNLSTTQPVNHWPCTPTSHLHP
jgi:hypothetical protein